MDPACFCLEAMLLQGLIGVHWKQDTTDAPAQDVMDNS
jgi:hypothetical protein